MRLFPTRGFEKDVGKIGPDRQRAVRDAIKQFLANPRHPGLHFEKLGGYADLHSIRSDGGDRVILRKREEPDSYELVAVGTHDVYGRLGRLSKR